MAHQRGSHLKTSARLQLAKVQPKSPGKFQVFSWCRVRAGPLPGGGGWAREGAGRTGALLSRQREEKGKQPNPEPDSQSANSCRSPNSGSSRGRRRVPGPPPLPLAPLGVQRGCGRQWGARPSSQNPPSVPAAAPAPLSFSCSGPSRQRRRDRGRGRARPARRLFAGSRKPRPREGSRWGRPPPVGRHPREQDGDAVSYPSPPPQPCLLFCAGFQAATVQGAAPQPEVCPGSRAASSFRARRAGPAACGPAGTARQLLPRRPRRTAVSPGVAGCAPESQGRTCRRLRERRTRRSERLRRAAGFYVPPAERSCWSPGEPRAPRPCSHPA